MNNLNINTNISNSNNNVNNGKSGYVNNNYKNEIN